VVAEAIVWLWERWIPAGMCTIHGGDGKSTVMASLLAALTTERPLPPPSQPSRPDRHQELAPIGRSSWLGIRLRAGSSGLLPWRFLLNRSTPVY
jgi:hypothetical protein